MLTIPWSGCSRPATRRKVVVLPAPLGPSSTKNSPLPIDRERSSTASTSRKRLVTPLRVTSAMGHFLAHDERAFAGQQPLRMAVVEQRALDAEGEADGRVKRHDVVLFDTNPHDTRGGFDHQYLVRAQVFVGHDTPAQPAVVVENDVLGTHAEERD